MRDMSLTFKTGSVHECCQQMVTLILFLSSPCLPASSLGYLLAQYARWFQRETCVCVCVCVCVWEREKASLWNVEQGLKQGFLNLYLRVIEIKWQNEPPMSLICEDRPVVMNWTSLLSGGLLRVRKGWLGHWMEELKASIGLGFRTNHLIFRAFIGLFSFLILGCAGSLLRVGS